MIEPTIAPIKTDDASGDFRDRTLRARATRND